MFTVLFPFPFFFFNVQFTSPLESVPKDGCLVISCHAHLLFSDISENDWFHNRIATYVREGQGRQDKIGEGGKHKCIQSCYFMLICRCFLLHKDIGNCAGLALLTYFVLLLFPSFAFCLIVASSCNQECVLSLRHHLFTLYLYDIPPWDLAVMASEWSDDTY